MEIATPRLLLREFRLEDYEDLLQYDLDPRTHMYEPASGPEKTHDFLAKALLWAQEQPRSRYRFAVALPESDTLIGQLHLSLNNSDIKEWEIGWGIHYEYWGQGFATEAAREVLRFAFEQLNIHRVVAFCHADNRASQRIMEKIGMKQEGRLRQVRLLNGIWADEWLYAVLDCEWTRDSRVKA